MVHDPRPGISRPDEDGEQNEIARARSYGLEAHELTRYRSQYSAATSARQRASSQAQSRRSLGPPKGLARVSFELKKFWRHQISVIVDQTSNRDHLGLILVFEFMHLNMQRITNPHYYPGNSLRFLRASIHALERTFLGYLRTSQALSMLGVIISQLFSLQHSQSPDPILGYYVVGKPLAAICQCGAMYTLILGTYRWWRQQNAMTRGKVLAGGFELTLIGLGFLLLSVTFLALVVAIEVRKD